MMQLKRAFGSLLLIVAIVAIVMLIIQRRKQQTVVTPVAQAERLLELSPDHFQQKVLDSTIPVVVDFYAHWCPSCQAAHPIFHQVAQLPEFAGKVAFFTANIDQFQEIAEQYHIELIPTFAFFKDGKLMSSATGYMTKEKLTEQIKQRFTS